MVLRRGILAATLTGLCVAVPAAQPAPMRLPTEWNLWPAPESEAQLGTFPQSATVTADGAHVIVVEAGAGPAALRILDAQTLAVQRAVGLPGVWGKPLADPSGSGFWAGTANANTIVHVDANTGAIDRTIPLGADFWPASIARSPDGSQLAVSGEGAGSVALVDLRSGSVRLIAVGRHPDGIAFSPSGQLIFVALWGENSLAVIDLGSLARAGTPGQTPSLQVSVRVIGIGRHPEDVALSPNGRDLYVSIPDDDSIALLDASTAQPIATVNVGLFDSVFFGASPSDIAVSADGSRVYVACGAANAIAVLRRSQDGLEAAGAIPAGWYPSAVALWGTGSLLIANAKGDGSYPNAAFDPYAADRAKRDAGYIALTLHGSLWRLPVPSDVELRRGAAAVLGAAPPRLRDAIEAREAPTAFSPAPADPVVRAHGPIEHVIYIIKENRTYDQVLGDVGGADGDPLLALFGERVTPNQHAIARRFGVFDNTYADAQVSADGHNWSTAAFANEYTERMWPPVYGGRRKTYDFEDGADAAIPRGGYLWNAVARAGLSLRNYGEFTTTTNGVTTSSMPDLRAATDPEFPGFDLTIKDTTRFSIWKREFENDVRSGSLPALEIVRLPNDHTAGTKAGAPGPQVYVADNDAAFGALVDAVSHSKFWASTAIIAIEDDAQNGPDHVDAQRTTLYVASPYARGGVHHVRHSTAGVLRTIELILGLPPMNAYDAGAQPLFEAFTATPDLRPFDALPAAIDMSRRNGPHAYRVADSNRFDFSHEDRVPDDELNDIIEHAARTND